MVVEEEIKNTQLNSFFLQLQLAPQEHQLLQCQVKLRKNTVTYCSISFVPAVSSLTSQYELLTPGVKVVFGLFRTMLLLF